MGTATPSIAIHTQDGDPWSGDTDASAHRASKASAGNRQTESIAKDRKKPHLCALKPFLQPLLLMLYTIGFFMGYQGGTNDGSSFVVGQYRLFSGENFT